MEWAIELLQQRNNYLTQFEKLTAYECRRLEAGDHNHIEQFYYSRQIILDAIANIDKRLYFSRISPVSGKNKKTVQDLLKKKRKTILSILKKDILIHSYLNNIPCYDTAPARIA